MFTFLNRIRTKPMTDQPKILEARTPGLTPKQIKILEQAEASFDPRGEDLDMLIASGLIHDASHQWYERYIITEAGGAALVEAVKKGGGLSQLLNPEANEDRMRDYVNEAHRRTLELGLRVNAMMPDPQNELAQRYNTDILAALDRLEEANSNRLLILFVISLLTAGTTLVHALAN